MKNFTKMFLAVCMITVFAFSVHAQSVGINSDGTAPDNSAILDVKSTSKGFLPPRMTRAERVAITSPVAGLMVFNTTTNCLEFYNGTIWMSLCGTTASVMVGDLYEGGIVAYIFQSSDPGYIAEEYHGLIVTTIDQSTSANWGCSGTAISGADGTAIGTGIQNTIDIMTGCATLGIAARICGDLVLQGYSDWYLPSKDELNKLYLNRVAIGGFTSGFYWSSSESGSGNAWLQDLTSGSQGSFDKSLTLNVRAVRIF